MHPINEFNISFCDIILVASRPPSQPSSLLPSFCVIHMRSGLRTKGLRKTIYKRWVLITLFKRNKTGYTAPQSVGQGQQCKKRSQLRNRDTRMDGRTDRQRKVLSRVSVTEKRTWKALEVIRKKVEIRNSNLGNKREKMFSIFDYRQFQHTTFVTYKQ